MTCIEEERVLVKPTDIQLLDNELLLAIFEYFGVQINAPTIKHI